MENNFLNLRLLASLYVDKLLNTEDIFMTEVLIERSPKLKKFVQIYKEQKDKELLEKEEEQKEAPNKIIVPDDIFGGKTKSEPTPRTILLWKKFAAASAVLFLIGLGQGLYIWQQKSKSETQLSILSDSLVAKNNEIAILQKETFDKKNLQLLASTAILGYDKIIDTSSISKSKINNSNKQLTKFEKVVYKEIGQKDDELGSINDDSKEKGKCSSVTVNVKNEFKVGKDINIIGSYERTNACVINLNISNKFHINIGKVIKTNKNIVIYDSENNGILRLNDNNQEVYAY